MNKKYKGIAFLASIVAACLFAVSCEEDETISYTHMTGDNDFELETFLPCSQLIDLEIGGVAYPDSYTVKWLIPKLYEDTLTGRHLTFKTPEEPGTLTITAITNAYHYYELSVNRSSIIIDTTKSLTGRVFEGNTITDPRDGQKYQITTAGNLDWFAENLKWAGTGLCYNDCDVLQSLFGRLYTWTEATGGEEGSGLAGGPQGICPDGWSIPTAEDWEDLSAALTEGETMPFLSNWAGLGQLLTVEAYLNDVKLWPISPDNNKKNSIKWNALPCGYNQRSTELYRDFMRYGMWWSSSKRSNDRAYYRYIYFDADFCGVNYANTDDISFSVRCVRRAS